MIFNFVSTRCEQQLLPTELATVGRAPICCIKGPNTMRSTHTRFSTVAWENQPTEAF